MIFGAEENIFNILFGIIKISSTFGEQITLMAKAKKKDNVEFESVKLRTKIVDKVRVSKKKTGIPIATFFEQAAEEKLITIKK